MSPEEKTAQRALDEQARKEKARWQRIFRVYGITKEQYKELDSGRCYICLRPWSDTVKPCVDHDHSTGEVRGLLCFYCNHRLVGRHRDGDLVQRIADYLKEPRRGWIVPKKKPKRRSRKGTEGPVEKRKKKK